MDSSLDGFVHLIGFEIGDWSVFRKSADLKGKLEGSEIIMAELIGAKLVQWRLTELA